MPSHKFLYRWAPSWTYMYMLIISLCIATKEHIQLDIDEVYDWVDGNHL